MTARTATVAFVLAASVMGCSRQLPEPNTASAAPNPTTAFLNEQPRSSPATPCHDWDLVGRQLEWTVDRCFTRPTIDTSPPPFHLAANVWSDTGVLRETADAPWKTPGDDKRQPRHERDHQHKSPRMLIVPRDERVSTHQTQRAAQFGG